jgi:hypothetical protein
MKCSNGQYVSCDGFTQCGGFDEFAKEMTEVMKKWRGIFN